MHDEQENEVFVMVMNVEMSRSLTKTIRERFLAGMCIRCGLKEAIPGRRGVCTTHWNSFIKYRPPKARRKARAKYEADCISKGFIMESHQGVVLTFDIDPCAAIAQRVER